jgi:Arc/MetJ family transcription regulator
MDSMGDTSVRRTNINLDGQLVDAAAAVLGTVRTTDTVHAALRDVVGRAARERLSRRDYSDLTVGALERMRQTRRSA